MISPTAEYALRAVVYLGSRAPDSQTNQQIAEGTKVPPAYLSKVLQLLGKAGILKSQRGLGGGYRLNGEPGALMLETVVRAVEEVPRIRSCPLGLEDAHMELCALHNRLDESLAHLERMLATTSLKNVLDACGNGQACRGPIPADGRAQAKAAEARPAEPPKSTSTRKGGGRQP